MPEEDNQTTENANTGDWIAAAAAANIVYVPAQESIETETVTSQLAASSVG
jgi:hypothetical protein